MKWTMLSKKKESDILINKLSEIAATLIEESKKEKKEISLMGGSAGIVLLLFYYARLTKESKYSDYANDLLVDIFDEINGGFNLHTYAGGLSGIGWLIEHLVQNDFIEPDTNEILSDLDPFLYKTMINGIKKGNYDFLHGALGNGTYFLSRLKNKDSKKYLIELVDLLDDLSIKTPNGEIKWKSILDKKIGTTGYNLSLSHGMSSIITFLSKVYELRYNSDKVSDLLNGAVKYLLSQQLDTEKNLSNFPSWIEEQAPPLHSRMAWCYGDLGIGMSLLQAGQSLNNKEWTDKAKDILLYSTKRTDLKLNSVNDAGLCHGTAGIAHIYNRTFHYTGEDVFKKSSLYWVDQTLKMATFEDGYCGYKMFKTEAYGGWTPELGLLEGIAGIGLMLISIVSDIEPKWDRCLLLS